MGDDQLRLGIAVDERGELTGDRRQTAAAMDQDRDVTFRGQSEDRREALVVQEEALRSGVELDPTRAEIEAAGCLLDRLLGQVEADEGDQLAAGALCVGEIFARNAFLLKETKDWLLLCQPHACIIRTDINFCCTATQGKTTAIVGFLNPLKSIINAY